MCDGGVVSIPLATALIGAATTVHGYNQQVKANNQMAQVQQDQIDSQAQQKTHERMQEARVLRASARASAAEAGVAGNSMGIFLDDIMGQAGQDVALIEVNRRNGVAASAAENRARQRGAKAEAIGGFATAAESGGNAYLNYKKYQIGGD